MMQEMMLHPTPFARMKSGKKTVELRLYDEKRRRLAVGDGICFRNREQPGEVLAARVKQLFVFPSFADLYARLPLTACGYTDEEVGRADPEDMRAFYSREEEERWGVVGIALEIQEEKRG